jgi:hypothetical protein
MGNVAWRIRSTAISRLVSVTDNKIVGRRARRVHPEGMLWPKGMALAMAGFTL